MQWSRDSSSQWHSFQLGHYFTEIMHMIEHMRTKLWEAHMADQTQSRHLQKGIEQVVHNSMLRRQLCTSDNEKPSAVLN